MVTYASIDTRSSCFLFSSVRLTLKMKTPVFTWPSIEKLISFGSASAVSELHEAVFGLGHSRQLIGVDGTRLTGNFGCIPLLAVRIDAASQVVFLAWVIVENESLILGLLLDVF